MNVFLLDADLEQCAAAFPDKLAVKMPLEHCQMLATAMAELGLGMLQKKDGTAYGLTHKHHPCTLWASADISNAYYIAVLGLALCNEYKQRYYREHACNAPLMHAEAVLREAGAKLSLAGPIFPIAIGDDCRKECYQLGFLEHPAQLSGELEQAIACYRHYMLSRKLHYACWLYSPVPSWWPSSASSGWLSCRLIAPKHSVKQSKVFSQQQADLLELSDNAAFALDFVPIIKPRAKKSAGVKPRAIASLAFAVPEFTLQNEPNIIREWLATKLSSKLPTAGTIAKWQARCAEQGGDERLQAFCKEHLEYWLPRGHGK